MSARGLMGCVSQSKYDDLEAQNQQLQQQNAAMSQQIAADKTQIGRLQRVIKYTVNSDLLFPSGGWKISEQGKQIIAKMAAKLAPTQQNKINVNGYTDNAPNRPGASAGGHNFEPNIVAKTCRKRYGISDFAGLNPSLVEAHGFGDAQPVASNKTPKGRAENRRVELTLAG
jgi:chemotaxis protein MotB